MENRCKQCGNALPQTKRQVGRCPGCAKKEIRKIKRALRNALITAVLLAGIVFLALTLLHEYYVPPRLNDNIGAVNVLIGLSRLSLQTRLQTALILFVIPFGYFGSVNFPGELPTASVKEQLRSKQYTTGRAQFDNEGMANGGLVIVEAFLAVITWPFYTGYRLIRLSRLRGYLAEVERLTAPGAGESFHPKSDRFN